MLHFIRWGSERGGHLPQIKQRGNCRTESWAHVPLTLLPMLLSLESSFHALLKWHFLQGVLSDSFPSEGGSGVLFSRLSFWNTSSQVSCKIPHGQHLGHFYFYLFSTHSQALEITKLFLCVYILFSNETVSSPIIIRISFLLSLFSISGIGTHSRSSLIPILVLVFYSELTCMSYEDQRSLVEWILSWDDSQSFGNSWGKSCC